MLAAMTLSGGDYGALAGLLTAFVGVPVGLVLVSIRGMAKRLDAVETRAHERIDTVETQLRGVDSRKVDKIDWLRETVRTRQKIDKLSEQVTRVSQQLEDAFGVGAAINNLADKLAKTLEQRNG